MKFKAAIKSIYLTFRTITLGSLHKIYRHRSDLPLESVKNIVIACQDRIGDAIMSLPAIAAVRKRFPDAAITCFAVEYIAGMIADSEYVDRVIVLKNRLLTDVLHAFALRKHRPDLGLDLQTDYTMRNALLFAAAGIRSTIGYNAYGRGLLYTKSLEIPPAEMHMVNSLILVSREAGASEPGPVPELKIPEQTKLEFANNHGDITGAKHCLVGIHPGGHYETQRWPVERFAETADALIDLGAKIVLIGGDRERESIERICTLMKKQPLIIIPRDLKELIAVIGFCKLLLCNNSGPLHIAAALGVPTVSTMGPTNSARWWPVGPHNHVLRKDIPCIGCNSGFCRAGTMECMNKITVEEMVAAAVGFKTVAGCR